MDPLALGVQRLLRHHHHHHGNRLTKRSPWEGLHREGPPARGGGGGEESAPRPAPETTLSPVDAPRGSAPSAGVLSRRVQRRWTGAARDVARSGAYGSPWTPSAAPWRHAGIAHGVKRAVQRRGINVARRALSRLASTGGTTKNVLAGGR